MQNKLTRRICGFSLAAVMLIGSSISSFADQIGIPAGTEMIAVGADHTEEQRDTVYQYFGAERDGTIPEVIVTNTDERNYLLEYISEVKIGTTSFSSVYIKVTEKGKGLNLTLNNISWLTEEAYINALTTVGITDADIVIASPISVSGTAALTGIYMAYEHEMGAELDGATKEAATEEQLQKLLSLARAYENVDFSAVQDKLREISDKLGTVEVDRGGGWNSII